MKLQPTRSRRLAAALVLALTGGCSELPKDPEETTRSVRGKVLRVGVAENPPWVRRSGEEPGGIEPALIRELAATLGAEVEWSWGSTEDLLAALERFELDLVAAGLTSATPWSRKVALSRPWAEVPIMIASPPGTEPPEGIEEREVAWSSPPLLPALIRERGGLPVRRRDLASHRGLVAAPIWWIEGEGWRAAGVVIHWERHAVALPPGENGWITTVERFLLARTERTFEMLRHEELP